METWRGAAGGNPGERDEVAEEADRAGREGPPERIGRYRIVAEIGRGGMAVVYRASLEGPRGFAKEVCLKRILPGAADDPAMVDMFEREARIAATLQHANVVQVFDFELHEGAPFLVMELVDGPSLWQVFHAAARAGRPISVAAACGMVVQALRGLHHVHTRSLEGRPMGLVHRDVSLHNLLLMRNGELKVADFGIARATQLGERTRTGVLKGKLAYIAPEYVATGKADHRGDLFSIGVVLHELLSGARRTPPATDAEGLGWVLHPEIAPLDRVRPDAGNRLAEVVASLTAALPGDRPADAAEAAERIAEAVTPATATEIARWVEALVPADGRSPHDPTLLAADGDLGETIPTPSAFDPTATRTPTRGRDDVTVGPPIRTDVTPDASTAVAEADVRRFRAGSRRRRRILAACFAGGGLIAAIGMVYLVVGSTRPGPERGPGAFGVGGGEVREVREARGAREAEAGASGAVERWSGGAVEAEGTGASGAVERWSGGAVEAEGAEGGAVERWSGGAVEAEGTGASGAVERSSGRAVVAPGPGPEDAGGEAGGASGEAAVGEPGPNDAAAAAEQGDGGATAVPGAGPGGEMPAGRDAGSGGATPAPGAARGETGRAAATGSSGSARPTGEGTLLVSVRPWAMVRIGDGEPVEVMARRFTLPAGRYRVRIDNDRNDCHLTRTVEVPAGGEAQVTENLIERCGPIAEGGGE